METDHYRTTTGHNEENNGVVETPAPEDSSIAQLLHLLLREHCEKGGEAHLSQNARKSFLRLLQLEVGCTNKI